MTKMISIHAVLFLVLTAATTGCCLTVPEEDGDQTTDTPAVTTAETPAEAPAGGACSRMAACCRAYVSAMGGSVPTSTCDAYNDVSNIPDSVCTQTMAGYRSGLSAMQKAIPADCN